MSGNPGAGWRRSIRLPDLGEVLDRVHVVRLPMRVRFRGLTEREVALVEGPAGWGEFGAFPEYDDGEAAAWLASGIEMAWRGPPTALRDRVAVNATVPAVTAGEVPAVLGRFPGAGTVKVKVAERGQTLDDDIARVAAVRREWPTAEIRVDANGGWSVPRAEEALRALAAAAVGPEATGLDYAEQPCASVGELVELRRRLEGSVRVAADESIRRAGDPLRVVRAGGADVAVVKAAPLGGPRRLLAIAAELAGYGVPVVVSSALDSAVGMGAGLAAAAALPGTPPACGLGTGGFFVEDVCDAPEIVGGELVVGTRVPTADRLAALAAPGGCRDGWIERIRRCHALLA